MIITRRFEVDYGHRLMKHGGKCANYHGHRGVIEVSFLGDVRDDGMVMDFGMIKEELGKMIDDRFDHKMVLQDGDPLCAFLKERKMNHVIVDFPPSAENLAQYTFNFLFEHCRLNYPRTPHVYSVRWYETPNCSAFVLVPKNIGFSKPSTPSSASATCTYCKKGEPGSFVCDSCFTYGSGADVIERLHAEARFAAQTLAVAANDHAALVATLAERDAEIGRLKYQSPSPASTEQPAAEEKCPCSAYSESDSGATAYCPKHDGECRVCWDIGKAKCPKHAPQPPAPVIVGLDTRDVPPAPVCERCEGIRTGAIVGTCTTHVTPEAGEVRVVTTGPDAREGCCTVLVGGLIVARGHYGDMDSLVASLRAALRPLLTDARRDGLREAAEWCHERSDSTRDAAYPTRSRRDHADGRGNAYTHCAKHLEALAAKGGGR